jgi:S1-C subfamily serine protease
MRPQISLTKIVFAACLLAMSSLLLAQQPATKPADKDPAFPEDAVIHLPDGREVKLSDLQKDGGAGIVMMRNDGGGTTVNAVDEDGRRITIKEDPDGIVVTVKDGDKDPVEYKAANVDELKQDHPEAAELYEKYHPDAMMPGGAGALGGPGGGGNPGVMGQRIMIRTGNGAGLHGPMMNLPMKLESLGARCIPSTDEFVKAQLGEGVRVAGVESEGLGARLGLKRHDFIKSVNGKTITSGKELDEALSNTGGAKVKLEVVRAGKTETLEEK